MTLSTPFDLADPPHQRNLPAARHPQTRRREAFLDLLRVAAIALVVLQHWLVPMLAVDGGVIDLDRTLVLGQLWPATWVTQVMPVVFFTTGAAAALSLRGRPPGPGWLSRRLTRLGGGVLVLAVLWLPLPVALTAAGVPADAVAMGGRLVGGLLWFLVVLTLLTPLTSVLLRIGARARGLEVVGLAVLAAGVDVLRFGFGWHEAGYLNAVLVWGAVYAAGLHYRRLTARPRIALAVGLGGWAGLALATTLGPYPAAMIGLPGTGVSNINPPSVAVLLLAAGQLGLLLAARGRLTRLAERASVTRFLARAEPRTMAVYLWHTPAVVLVSAVVLSAGWRAPEVGSPAWWLTALGWLLALAAALAVILTILPTDQVRPPVAPPSRTRTTVATAALAAGLLVLTVAGFDPSRLGDLVGPVIGCSLLVVSLLALGARYDGAPVPAVAATAAGGAPGRLRGTLGS